MCDFRPAVVAPLVVVLLLMACGDEPARTSADDTDVGVIDAGADAECVGSACQRLEPVGTAAADCAGGELAFTEHFAEGGVCVPQLSDWACPSGFVPTVELGEHQVADGTEPLLTTFSSCRPPLPPAECPPGSMPVAGRETCLRMGSECPPDGQLWPTEQIIRSLAAPRQGRIVYVHQQALAGDGSEGQRTNPFRSFAEAVDFAGSDDIIALSVGTHRSDYVSVDAPLAVVGACTEGSILTGGSGWERPVLAIEGDGASLILRQVTISASAGLYVGTARGRTTISNVRFDLAASPYGIWDGQGASRVELSNVYMTGIWRRELDDTLGTLGFGLYLLHSELDAERVTITDGVGGGVFVGNQGIASLRDVIIGDFYGSAERNHAGYGIIAFGEGTSVDAERVIVTRTDGAGVVATQGGHLSLRDALILGHRPQEPPTATGAGIEASAGGRVDGSQIMIENIVDQGVLVTDLHSEVNLERVVIRRDAGESRTLARAGVEVWEAGRAALTSVLVVGGDAGAVFATGQGTHVDLSEALLIGTAAPASAETAARALVATERATVWASQVVVAGTAGIGVLALGRGSMIDLADAVIHDTQDACTAQSAACDGAAGLGVVAADYGVVGLERFVVSASARVGTLAVAPGDVSLRHGVVTDNAVGAAFSAAYADDETPWFAVRFVDNLVDRMLQPDARTPVPQAR